MSTAETLEADLPPVLRIAGGVLYALLCVREGTTDEQAADAATGIEAGLLADEIRAIRETDPALAATVERAGFTTWRPTPADEIPEKNRALVGPCDTFDNRRHVLVNC